MSFVVLHGINSASFFYNPSTTDIPSNKAFSTKWLKSVNLIVILHDSSVLRHVLVATIISQTGSSFHFPPSPWRSFETEHSRSQIICVIHSSASYPHHISLYSILSSPLFPIRRYFLHAINILMSPTLSLPSTLSIAPRYYNLKIGVHPDSERVSRCQILCLMTQRMENGVILSGNAASPQKFVIFSSS